MKLKFVKTNCPRLYDTSLKNFRPRKDKNYSGHRVRIHVKVPEKVIDYERWLNNQRQLAEKLFKNASILLVPEFEEQKHATKLPENSSDREKIVAYVGQTIPANLERRRGAIIEYICGQLQKAMGVSLSRRPVQFVSVFAENILCFEKVMLEFRRGVHLITGTNEDWNNGSNGSGKSSLLQLLRIGLYGSTTKGQSGDRLVRRNHPEGSKSRVTVFFGVGQKDYNVHRQRLPHKLRLERDGRDISSGNSRKKTGVSTQEIIEKSVGMTMDMFDHSVIIDQKLLQTAGSFLDGTDKEKKQLLDEFLGTARFLKAGELVRHSLTRCQKEIDDNDELIERRREVIRVTKEHLEQAKKDKAAERNALRLRIRKRKETLAQIDYNEKRDKKIQSELIILEDDKTALWEKKSASEQREIMLKESMEEIRDRIVRLMKKETTICPECEQTITPEHRKLATRKLGKRVDKLEAAVSAENAKQIMLRVKINKQTEKIKAKKKEMWEEAGKAEGISELKSAIKELRLQLKTTGKEKRSLESMRKTLRTSRRRLATYKQARTDLVSRQAMLAYCETVLSRRGLVNFLYEQICAQLNEVARFYSEIFTEGVIQLRFSPVTERKSGEIVNEFSVDVINTQGGETRRDQSRGEEQLASLMCILSLREIGVQSNLLILDEPTEGLDTLNARRFAMGLDRLQEKFPCILLATHNEHIKARFREENSLHLVKKNKIARLETLGINR